MAEVVHPGYGPGTPVRPMLPLAPLGQGLAAAPPPERLHAPPSPQAQQKAVWGAGPGAGGQSPLAMQPHFISTSGVRMKQMSPYAGASEVHQPVGVSATEQRRIKDLAAPYQKEAAIRSAEGAIRPWSAYAGLGERRGAQFSNLSSHAANYAGQAPSQFRLPDAAYAAAVAASANQVARPGSGQMDTAGAWSPVAGHPARELWPVDLNQPPKYCVACRGGHQEENEMSDSWEPYTPTMRLTNLNVLNSMFQHALIKGQLCVAINDSRIEPVRWTWKVKDADGDEVLAQPRNLSKQDFIKQLALMFDGLREGHEPYRHLATQAAHAFLDVQSPFIPEAVPALVPPLRLALQTYEPSLVGHALMIMQRLLRSHPKAGAALVPHLKHLLPAVALMKRNHFVVHLPPPFCVGSAGSFTGHGFAPETGNRKCKVCDCPLDKEQDSKKKHRAAKMAAIKNPHLLEQELPSTYSRHPIQGRYSKKYLLEDVIKDTLDLLVEKGGSKALAGVMNFVPTFSYYNPKG